MRQKWYGSIRLAAGAFLLVTCAVFANPASASSNIDKHRHATVNAHHSVRVVAHSDNKHPLSKTGKARYSGGGEIQCVTFARAASGIALKGNAANWWDAAAGVYDRGNRPEAGSVLNFRANGNMRLGHVAVVTNVLGAREIEIDHANWNVGGYTKGNVSRSIRVMDVSDRNDWSQVRVELGHTQEFGSVYPAYGFIYDRPDSGRMVANSQPNSQPNTGAYAARVPLNLDEVAEAPLTAGSGAILPVDAAHHTLR